MQRAFKSATGIFLILTLGCVITAVAQDWPQWRGPNRDAKAIGFHVPATWPKTLTKKWETKVGDGVATPALVDGKLYVFTRQHENEILRCLDAFTGEDVWHQEYASAAAQGPAGGFPGPRSSPTVSPHDDCSPAVTFVGVSTTASPSARAAPGNPSAPVAIIASAMNRQYLPVTHVRGGEPTSCPQGTPRLTFHHAKWYGVNR